jgi:superfamily II DNA or RNA helicase
VNVDCDIVIAMLQSLAMKDYDTGVFDSVGMVIVDEAHHICAKVFSQALFKFCPKYTLGLTATPDRKDGLTDILYWFMGPSILSIEREQRGRTIVNTTVFGCDHYKSPPPVTRFGKVSLVQMITDLVELEERNQMIEDLAREHVGGTSRRLLILSGRRAHCLDLAERLSDLGTGLYMGGMKAKDLAESAEKKIIVGTFSQAHEGLDIPVLDTIILATPKSDVKQAVGRILRETEGKTNDALILDIRDKWGLLSSMYYKRRALYKKSGFEFDACSGPDDDPPARKKLLTGFSFL